MNNKISHVYTEASFTIVSTNPIEIQSYLDSLNGHELHNPIFANPFRAFMCGL